MSLVPILITGGTGFVGSHLVEAVLATGEFDVHVTTSNTSTTYVHTLLPADHIHVVDLSEVAQTRQLLERLRPQQLYHLAAYAAVGTSFEQAEKVLVNNAKIQVAFLEAVKSAVPQARVIVVGSGMEYDVLQAPLTAPIAESHTLGPVSPYAVSKVIQDLLGLSYFYSYGLDIVRARPFNHIGERQSTDFAIPSFATQIVAIERGTQREIKVGNLDAVRDFTDVKDVARAYLLLMAKGQSGEVYNIGSGRGYKMHEILTMLCQLAQVPVTVRTDQNKVRPLDVPIVICDAQKIQALGWQPQVPIQDTLQRILNEWRLS